MRHLILVLVAIAGCATVIALVGQGPATKKAAAPEESAWIARQQVDPMDNSVTNLFSVESKNGDGLIQIVCRKTDKGLRRLFQLATHQTLDPEHSMEIKLDDGAIQKPAGFLSKSNKNYFVYEGPEGADALILQVLKAKTAKIRLWTSDGDGKIYEFTLPKPDLKAMDAACDISAIQH